VTCSRVRSTRSDAVGVDVFNREPNVSITITAYSGASVIDSFVVPTTGVGTSQFIGVSSDSDLITRVRLGPDDDLYFAVDDVVFGDRATPAVPALGAEAAATLIGMLSIVAALRLRARPAT